MNNTKERSKPKTYENTANVSDTVRNNANNFKFVGKEEKKHICQCENGSKDHSCSCGGHSHAENCRCTNTSKQVEAVVSLEDTIALMTSSDFKDRLRAEYWQTKLRYENLKKLNNVIEASEYGIVEFSKDAFKTPRELFRAQQAAMGEYLHILEIRAIAERVEL